MTKTHWYVIAYLLMWVGVVGCFVGIYYDMPLVVILATMAGLHTIGIIIWKSE